MNDLVLALSRWQFGITTVYHFFFVPLTLGLSILVAVMQTMYYRTGDETYKKMTKFWGKLFIINFAMGVVTGIVQEFQFGMNWSEFSRFVGDVFGAPLAIEALLAFFLESTFLGLWIFGWDKLPKGIHLATIWLVALGSNLSAYWILVANSFMQQPVGYVISNGRAELVDFWALVTNPNVLVQFPHVFTAGLVTAGFFVLPICAYHLLKGSDDLEVFQRSFRLGIMAALIGSITVMLAGHSQAQHVARTQPMKLASAEALWDSADPAPMSLFTIGDLENLDDVFAIKMPCLLSILAYNKCEGEVQGIKDLQVEYEQTYGPGDYIPFVPMIYWSFRSMIGAGVVMALFTLYGLYLILRNRVELARPYLWLLIWAIALPYIANSSGWVFAEMGRQPWLVFGLQLTPDGVSINVPVATVAFSLIGFTVLYGALMVAEIYLLVKFAKRGVGGGSQDGEPAEAPAGTPAGAYLK